MTLSSSICIAVCSSSNQSTSRKRYQQLVTSGSTFLKTRIEATIKGEGDMIGWEDDEETNGPNAWRAKRTLQEVVPHLLPEHNDGVLYRLMLEYGDFGIHNTSVTKDDQGNPSSPFLYDWETACIVPALLADPLVAADPVNLIAYSCAEPAASQAPESATATDPENFEAWSKCCFKVGCFIMTMCSSPDMACGSGCTSTFQISKSLSKPAKTFHICGSHCAIGEESGSEAFFGNLWDWAEGRVKELSVP
jgi:hypothetical protein